MIIKPTDIDPNPDKAKIGFVNAAQDEGRTQLSHVSDRWDDVVEYINAG